MSEFKKVAFHPDDPEVQGKEALGLYDIKEHCWIGNKDGSGPVLYLDPLWAECAAEIAATQMGVCMLRIRPKPWPPGTWKYKDELKTIMSGEDAVKHLEEGGI